tara:strand:+ start:829 stop:1254 length:426 start_codon:yes stop_codon:yes gene_type:complete
MANNNIIGTWRLVSYFYIDKNGETGYPLGPNPKGYITYTEDGYMSVSMSASDRPNRSTDDLLDGTDEEKIAEAATYISYCGKYDLYDDRVVHKIEVALFPNRVGTSQTRYYKFEDDKVILTTPPISIHNMPQVCTIVWERA